MVIEVSCHTGPYYDDKHVPVRHVHGPHEHMYHNVLHVEPMDQSCNCHQLNIDPEPFDAKEKPQTKFLSVTARNRESKKKPTQTKIVCQSVCIRLT